jgi:type II secretory pathway pseudopilin PulG
MGGGVGIVVVAVVAVLAVVSQPTVPNSTTNANIIKREGYS